VLEHKAKAQTELRARNLVTVAALVVVALVALVETQFFITSAVRVAMESLAQLLALQLISAVAVAVESTRMTISTAA
jgi:hypothetical protein